MADLWAASKGLAILAAVFLVISVLAYTLHAAPLNPGGSDGAPCRAYLMR